MMKSSFERSSCRDDALSVLDSTKYGVSIRRERDRESEREGERERECVCVCVCVSE